MLGKKRLSLKVYGQVQGVSFRYYTVRKAQELGLTGFVQNLPDGRVLIVAEGRAENLQQLLTWCWQEGPTTAQVRGVEVQWGSGTGEFDKFGIGS